jgi:hypothetical protein
MAGAGDTFMHDSFLSHNPRTANATSPSQAWTIFSSKWFWRYSLISSPLSTSFERKRAARISVICRCEWTIDPKKGGGPRLFCAQAASAAGFATSTIAPNRVFDLICPESTDPPSKGNKLRSGTFFLLRVFHASRVYDICLLCHKEKNHTNGEYIITSDFTALYSAEHWRRSVHRRPVMILSKPLLKKWKAINFNLSYGPDGINGNSPQVVYSFSIVEDEHDKEKIFWAWFRCWYLCQWVDLE